MPTIKDVAYELRQRKRWMEGDYIDVRLQVMSDGSWAIHTGDAQYDTDHRGYWWNETLTKRSNCRDLARDMICEVGQQIAMTMDE